MPHLYVDLHICHRPSQFLAFRFQEDVNMQLGSENGQNYQLPILFSPDNQIYCIESSFQVYIDQLYHHNSTQLNHFQPILH